MDLRRRMRAELAKVSPAVRLAASLEACERLKPQLHCAAAILFFAPLPDELDLWPVLEDALARGISCALPSFNSTTQTYSARLITNLENQIVPGQFGVREPHPSCTEIPMDQFNLILVPGMAFDLEGNRLGRGLGFYDRILANISRLKCGVCHDGQLFPKIPSESSDVRLDFVLTPSKLVRCKS